MKLSWQALALWLLPCGALPLHAIDRVLLQTGFEVECVHREVLQDGHIRLYTNAQSYMDVSPQAIQSITHIDDPAPVLTPPPTTQVHGQTAPSSSPVAAASMKQMLAEAETRHHVDSELLAAVIHAESGGNPHAVSRAGAQGLMQLMPGTASSLGVKDTFAAGENLNGGSAYLDQLLTRYHDDMALALAAYNAGPAAVDKYHGVPPYRETRAYVARIIKEFNRRKSAQLRAER